jgi:DnaJ-class molecular chaperone
MSSGQYQERPLVIKVAAQPHKVFRRFRDHLVMNLDISVLDMLCGFSTTVSMLDETLLRIHSPKLFPYVHGTVLKVRGRGFTSTGNLFVELKLVPLAATIQDMDHIQQLEAILGQKCTRDYNAVENSAVVDPRQFQADTSTTPNSSKSASECHVQ